MTILATIYSKLVVEPILNNALTMWISMKQIIDMAKQSAPRATRWGLA